MKKEATQDFYDFPYYEMVDRKFSSGAYSSKVESILHLLTVGESTKLDKKTGLDVGCGGGFFTNAFAKAGLQMTGVDFSPSAIEFAKGKYANSGIDFRVASVYNLPFPDESFDFIFLIDVIEHLEFPDKAFKEIYRVLKFSSPNSGHILLATDLKQTWLEEKLFRWSLFFSREGRIYRKIKKDEYASKSRKNYQDSHLKEYTYEEVRTLLKKKHFFLNYYCHLTYPLVKMPLHKLVDFFWRGNHQCIFATKIYD